VPEPPSRSCEADERGFYIEAGCCVLCGVPESIAPNLFQMDEHSCFLVRQPRSSTEIDQVIDAMASSELECIRYGGADDALLQRIGQAGLALNADDPRAAAHPPIIRNRVFFHVPGEPSAARLASRFRAHLRSLSRFTVKTTFRRHTVRFSWWKRHFHEVIFESSVAGGQIARLLPEHPEALHGLARTVDEWLRKGIGAESIVWNSWESARTGVGGLDRPY